MDHWGQRLQLLRWDRLALLHRNLPGQKDRLVHLDLLHHSPQDLMVQSLQRYRLGHSVPMGLLHQLRLRDH